MGKDMFVEMKAWGFIDHVNQFLQGTFTNPEGKCFLIKRVQPKRAPKNIDAFVQYAHVVKVGDKYQSDPAIVLGFDMINKVVYPLVYRNDLLDHTIQVYEAGNINEDHAEWLMKYWSDWMEELAIGEYGFHQHEHAEAC